MFQKAILVKPEGTHFMGHENFIQEAFVGYKYGTFSKLGIICERTTPSGGEEAMDVDEESKVEPVAATNNMNKFNL